MLKLSGSNFKIFNWTPQHAQIQSGEQISLLFVSECCWEIEAWLSDAEISSLHGAEIKKEKNKANMKLKIFIAQIYTENLKRIKFINDLKHKVEV